MTIEEVTENAKIKAEKADSDTLVSWFEGALISYHDNVIRCSQDAIDKAYARYEVFREELLKRLG